MSLTTTIKREKRGIVGDNPVADLWLSFGPKFLSSCWISLVASRDFVVQKVATNQLFSWESCVVQQDTIYCHQDYEQPKFYKWLRLFFIGGSVRDKKVTCFFTIGPKMGHFNQSLTKFTFLSELLAAHLTMLCRKNWEISHLFKVKT